MITFEEALAMQAKLQEKTYGKPLSELTDEEIGAAALLHVTALTDELHEVLRETPWKPWKKQQKFDGDFYRAEMVDAFHFFMNLMLIGNMSVEDLLGGYEFKHAVNIQRQKEGY